MLTKLILMFILGFGVAFCLMMLVIIHITFKEDDDAYIFPTDEDMDQMYIESFFEENKNR